MFVFVCVCARWFLCRQGWYVFNGKPGNEVHERPVLAHFRRSVFASQYSMPFCPSTMTPGRKHKGQILDLSFPNMATNFCLFFYMCLINTYGCH